MSNNKKVLMIELKQQAADDVSFYQANDYGIDQLLVHAIYGYQGFKDVFPDKSPDEYVAYLGIKTYHMTQAQVNKIPEV